MRGPAIFTARAQAFVLSRGGAREHPRPAAARRSFEYTRFFPSFPQECASCGRFAFQSQLFLDQKRGFQRTQTALLGSGEGEHRGVGNRQYQRRRSRTEVGGPGNLITPTHTRITHLTLQTPREDPSKPSSKSAAQHATPPHRPCVTPGTPP